MKDPFLAEMIKNNQTSYPTDRWEVFRAFHDSLYEDYSTVLQGDRQIILKMLSFWEYFAEKFPNPNKAYKRIKKTKNLSAFEEAVSVNFDF